MNDGRILFDGKDLFGPGEHVIIPQAWQRRRIDYAAAGLDGVVSLDLGRRSRTLRQTGRLSADSVNELQKMIAAIEARSDGGAYELFDRYGTSYNHVRLDGFQQKGPIRRANLVCCDYEIIYTQLSE